MENTRHIMVVDDDAYMTDILQNLLADEGYRVTIANEGQQALDLFRENQPDLMILDIRMPGKSGYEVLEELRKESNMPVIILTGIGEIDTLVRMMSLGANDYVVKPFREQELLARIRAKLRRARAKET